MNGLVVVDCRVGSVGSGDYDALSPVAVEIFGGQMRTVHVSGRHRQLRNGQAHITWMRNGMQPHHEDTEIKTKFYWGEERDKHGQKNLNCFQFTIDYMQYDANNRKMKSVVQLVNLFISEFTASS